MKKRLNVGVISCSGMAQSHMAAVSDHDRADLVAVCDIDQDLMNDVADRFSVERRYTDYRELISQEDIDAVIIVTPDQLHREMVEAAVQAGKHVLCEKPLALTREDLRAIVDAAGKSDRVFMVGQICRFTPGFVAAKRLIDAGEIGELFFVESEYAHDYEKIIGRGSGWRADPLRNGVVGGGCHAVDLLRWVAGDPYEISAYSNHKMLSAIPTDDCTIAIMRFPNDVIGKAFVSIGCKRSYTMRSLFYGTRGTIIADNTSPDITVFKSDVAPDDSLFEGRARHEIPISLPVQLNNHNTFGEFRAFADSILNGAPVEMTAAQGAKTIEACLSIVESADGGAPVRPDYSVYE